MSAFHASSLPILGLSLLLAGGARPAPGGALPPVSPNRNLQPAGRLRGGVLTVALEARRSAWQINGPARPAMAVEAFSEPGRAPLVPGPLLRVPRGTEIRVSVRNTLETPLTFFIPAVVRGGPDRMTAMDSVVVAPGGVGRLTTRASVPGNFVYRATTPAGVNRLTEVAGLLAGALVVDTAAVVAPARDRVFVIMEAPDSEATAYLDTVKVVSPAFPVGREVFTINGLSWPATERIHATVGDSLHWRVINATNDVHPMHLHGFYYRVDAFAGPEADRQGRPAPGQMVVTQLMTPFSGMSMTWSPDRPGNWLFHCHFALHLQPDSVSAAPGDPHLRGMVGLVIGTLVAERPGARPTSLAAPARRLRLVAVTGPAPLGRGPDSVPSMHFVLEENGRRTDTGRDFSPELDLTRGEPVSITILNRLAEPTSVHWHGIEIQDSYYDGVPGFSGEGDHLTPAIAPGDSFVAHFAPSRSGTFMYHAHIDDVPEQAAGLEGALIVRDPGATPAPDDHVFFLKGAVRSRAHPLEIDGQPDPDTVVLHVGRTARLRLINLATTNPVPWFWLTARPDSALTLQSDPMVVRWLPVAKDGFDRPASARVPRTAGQIVAMGETYDFEYTPHERGMLRLEVRANGRQRRLLIRVPIRVE